MASDTIPHLIDTHCHLDFQAFEEDRDQVVEEAINVGVVSMIDPGIDLISSRRVVELTQEFPRVYAAVGVHPNESAKWDGSALKELEGMALDRKVVAIGEIGLDYYRDRVSRQDQILAFEAQLDLAATVQLPVIIHQREASADLLDILSAWTKSLGANSSQLSSRPGVLHSFSSGGTVAEQAIEMNFLIGITGPVTFPNAESLQRVVKQIPLEHLLIETDAPFLSPQPRRGRRNEPGNVLYVAKKIAELKKRSFEEVASHTTANAQMLFQIGEKSFV